MYFSFICPFNFYFYYIEIDGIQCVRSFSICSWYIGMRSFDLRFEPIIELTGCKGLSIQMMNSEW